MAEVFRIVFVLVITVATGCFSGRVADAKGYSYAAWFVGGFFFSILALIAVAGMPDRKAPQGVKEEMQFKSSLPPIE